MTTAQPTRRVALAFFAHPDDAEFLCAGVLARLAHEIRGWEIHIATATAGDCGTTSLSPDEISRVRINEAQASARLIGAQYHCLAERDAYVAYDKPTLRKTIDLFRAIAPTLVFTHALHDYLMDHEIVAQLARAASFAYGVPNVTDVPLVQGSCVPHLYYCDPIEGVDPLGNPVEPTTVIDISSVIQTKTRMLESHASQRDWLRAHHGVDEYIDSMKRLAAQRGRRIGKPFAEGFVQHRGHAYPRNDLLAELLP
jgi:LmbE family N-acetylglucosaminyl deacetylase